MFFLGKDSTLPVIIVADLSEKQVEALVSILKRFIRAIGWTIANIIGIPPGICSHKSNLCRTESLVSSTKGDKIPLCKRL